MDKFAAGKIQWLQKRAVPIVVALTLTLLTILVWKQRVLLYSFSAGPTPTLVPKGWVLLSAPFDGKIKALVVEDPNGSRMLYAGTDGGVFKSDDGGRTWTPCNNGLDDRLVRSLAIDPDDPNTLYAGTWNGKVYTSNNGGVNWQECSDHTHRLPSYEILALAVHTHNPDKVYAATPTGVFTSTDRGQHWHPAGEFTSTLQCMAMDSEHPDILYVGTSAHGIHKSLNGALAWFPLPNDPENVSVLVIPPRAPGTVYAISKGKVYKTEESGNFWKYVDYYRDTAMARCLAVNPKNPQEVYVGVQDGLYKSVDGRKSWFRSDTGLKDPREQPVDVQIVVVDPIETSTVYACSGNKFFVSNNAGYTWELRSTIQANSEASILALKADPKDGRTFYASVAGGGLYKTTNGGNDWQHIGDARGAQPVTPFIAFTKITAIDIDPVDTRIVYMGTAEGMVSKSNDGGTMWAPSVMVTEATISCLAIDPEQTERIYAGTEGKGLFRSDDGGLNWVHKGEDIGKKIQRIVIDPRGVQTAIYAITEKGVFISRNSGESWQLYLFGVADIAPPIKGSLRPLTVTSAEVGEIRGQGQGDVVFIQQKSVALEADLKQLTISPAIPYYIYVLANHQGVLQSTDGGATWSSLGLGLEGRELRALAFSPDDANLILVGTDQGIYRYQP